MAENAVSVTVFLVRWTGLGGRGPDKGDGKRLSRCYAVVESS